MDKPRIFAADGKLPRYTEAYAKRSAVMQHDILRKLKKDYGIDPDIIKLDPGTIEYIQDPIYRLDDKIKDRLDRAAVHSGITLSEEQAAELEGIGKNLAESVYGIFQLRRSLYELVDKGAASRDALNLENIYASHVVIEAMAKIRTYFKYDEDAFSIAGAIINEMVGKRGGRSHHNMIQPIREANLRGPARQAWQEDVLAYPEKMLDLLNQSHQASSALR